LTPALLNHSSRAYTWGAAIAALHGITFDRELLYLAAIFHDTGIPSPVPDVDCAWYLHRFAMSDLSIRLAPFRD